MRIKTKRVWAILMAIILLVGVVNKDMISVSAADIVTEQQVEETTATENETIVETEEVEPEIVETEKIIEYLPVEQPEGFSVKAFTKEGVLPKGTVLIVKKVESKDEIHKIAEEAMDESSVDYEGFFVLDIGFWNGAEEVEPAEGSVNVQIEVNQEMFPENVDMDSIAVHHLAGEHYVVETVTETVEEEKDSVIAEFDVTSFSPFTITFNTGANTDLVDYYGNKISLAQYISMLEKVHNTIETKWTDNNSKISNLPVIDWKRSSTPARVTRPELPEANEDTANINWKWSDVSGIQTDLTNIEDVWDGARLIENNTKTNHHFIHYLPNNTITADVSKNGAEKLYDSATWTHSTGSDWECYSMYRFTGTFDISNTNPNEYAYTVTPVTQDEDGDRLYMNDDLYVFVYPVGTTITDENFLNYLAFWSGTSTNTLSRTDANGNLTDNIKFHDRSGTTARKQGAAADLSGFWKLTDGWNMPAVTDNAGGVISSAYKNNPNQPKYVIDVFASDYSDGGGMYRLQVEAREIKKAHIQFVKVDEESKNPLEGAIFALEKDGVHYEATSDKDGIVEFYAVPGTYKLTEKAAPENYEATNKTWTIIVEDDSNGNATGNYKIIDDTTNQEVSQDDNTAIVELYQIDNSAVSKTLTVSKDVTGNVADMSQTFEFTMTLKNRAGNAYVEDLVSTGVQTSLKASEGKYSFTLKDDDEITITIPYGYEYTVTEKDYSDIGYKTTINGSTSEQREITGTLYQNASVEYLNHRDALIDTGVETTSTNTHMGLLYGALVSIITVIAMYIIRRRRFS